MCGISGLVSFKDSFQPDAIINMTNIISYRGPDDYGYFAYNSDNKHFQSYKENFDSGNNYNLFLGHRRLSILDLTDSGHQPMSYLDGKYWITYNGEVYNYIEIKNELIKKGYSFHSNTDTEVILASYHEWKENCLTKFNGMWAFAIIDTERNELFCARDRLGIKPFYYNISNGIFSFSSEIKQLLSLKHIEAKENYNATIDFFLKETYNSIDEETFFLGIKELKGGHYAYLNLNKSINNLEPVKFWDIDITKKIHGQNDKQFGDMYLELFQSSVNLRLRSDVPVGSALSGGLDSSGIVCMVDRILKEKGVSEMQKTFTSTSDVKKFDETTFAKEVINSTNVDPYFVLPSVELLLKDFDKLIWHQEEPFVSTSIFAGWCVSRLTKESGVTVSLDGQGPDEMFGGYYPYDSILGQNLTEFSIQNFISNYKYYKDFFGLKNSHIFKKVLSSYFRPLIPFKLIPYTKTLLKIFKDSAINEYVNPYLRREKSRFNILFKPFDDYSYSATMHSPLPGILKQVDRNSMAFSLETRLPFLDYRLVELVFSLPLNQKIRNGISKYVYRNAMNGILPNKIKNRESKLGFVTAEPSWLKTDKMGSKFRDIFNSIDDSSVISKDFILNNFNNFTSGNGNFDTIYWRVFNYEVWKNIYIK